MTTADEYTDGRPAEGSTGGNASTNQRGQQVSLEFRPAPQNRPGSRNSAARGVPRTHPRAQPHPPHTFPPMPTEIYDDRGYVYEEEAAGERGAVDYTRDSGNNAEQFSSADSFSNEEWLNSQDWRRSGAPLGGPITSRPASSPQGNQSHFQENDLNNGTENHSRGYRSGRPGRAASHALPDGHEPRNYRGPVGPSPLDDEFYPSRQNTRGQDMGSDQEPLPQWDARYSGTPTRRSPLPAASEPRSWGAPPQPRRVAQPDAGAHAAADRGVLAAWGDLQGPAEIDRSVPSENRATVTVAAPKPPSPKPPLREAGPSRPKKLPVGALIALACAGFVTMMAEAMPAGLLLPMGQGLGVDEAMAGQLVGIYALGCAAAAVPLTALTRSWNRKALLMGLMLVFLAATVITAYSPDYWVTFGARLAAGMSAGVVWSMLAGYATRISPENKQGRGMSIAMAGTPLALSAGIPLGSYLGNLVGWRETFWGMAGATVILLVWMMIVLPNIPGEHAHHRRSFMAVLRLPGLLTVLFVTGAFSLGHNVVYTYINPLADKVAGANGTALALLVFGISAAAGLFWVGARVDGHLRALIVTTTSMLWATLLALSIWLHSPMIGIVAVALWGLSFGGTPTLVQTASAYLTGPSQDVGQALIVMVWNGSVMLGSTLGGFMLRNPDTYGIDRIPWAGMVMALLAMVAVLLSRVAFAGLPAAVDEPEEAAAPATRPEPVVARTTEAAPATAAMPAAVSAPPSVLHRRVPAPAGPTPPPLSAEKLLRMEHMLQRRVVGQGEAIRGVCDAVRRSFTGLTGPNRPRASFLFIGTSGVGKSELARCLAGFLYGSERAVIKLSMGDFAEHDALDRLIGSGPYPGPGEPERLGLLTEAVRERPYSVIMLDEVEQAHPMISGTLIQMLEQGTIVDGHGHSVDFRGSVVVMSSTLGAALVRDADTTPSDQVRHVVSALRSTFRPDLVDGLDDVIVFNTLTANDLADIVGVQIELMEARLRDRNISIYVTENARHWLAYRAYDNENGARRLQHLLQREVGDLIACGLLSGDVRDGGRIRVDLTQDGSGLLVTAS